MTTALQTGDRSITSEPEASGAAEHRLRRHVGLRGLTLISLGSIIGSGWLLGALGAAQSAGPASLLSWILAGSILATLALVHAELGSTYPLSAGTARFPFLSFGAMGGFTGALMAWIQAVTIGPIEVEAALGYLQSSFPHLGLESSSGTLTGLGILVAALCLAGFTYVNVLGVISYLGKYPSTAPKSGWAFGLALMAKQTIPFWWDLAAVAASSLLIYYAAVRFAQSRDRVAAAIAAVEEELAAEESELGAAEDRRRVGSGAARVSGAKPPAHHGFSAITLALAVGTGILRVKGAC